MKKLFIILLTLLSFSSFSQESNLTGFPIGQSFDRSGTCASPDAVDHIIAAPPSDYNYLNTNGYCYTISPAVKDLIVCYTMTAGSTSIDFNAGYNVSGCSGLNINYARLYTSGSCILISNAAIGTVSGLVIGTNYTWCISLKCTGPGPGFSTFCPYYQNISPLPIELTSFDCFSNDHIILNWTTASETNNDFFMIQRSVDGINWIYIGTVDGAGNSTSITHYKFNDYFPKLGTNYYKLIQQDFDGKITSSSIIECSYEKSDSYIIEYRNILGQEVDINKSNPGIYIKYIKSSNRVQVEKFYKH